MPSFTLCNICYVNEEQCYNLCLCAIKCHCLFTASTVDWNLQQADIKNVLGYRMAKKGRAAFVHTIWNVQVLCLPTHMLVCYVFVGKAYHSVYSVC